jgi:Predicted secreted (periplasmic) protein
MLRTIDLIMIGAMVVAATVTYQIKHHAEDKLEDVRRLEAEIRLERDTIDLLKADWALLTQPNRLERLVEVYGEELKLQPTEPTQLARPMELPMLRSQLPQPEVAEDEIATTDPVATGSVKP